MIRWGEGWNSYILRPLLALAAGTFCFLTNSVAALEVTGRVAVIDLEADQIILQNGKIFDLDGTDVGLSLKENDCVTISFAVVGARNLIATIVELPEGSFSMVTKEEGGACPDH